MNFNNLILIVLLTVFLNSCGEGVVEILNVSYQPKISIDGFLIPNQKVDKIHVFRNFKLDQDLNDVDFFPENTTVSIMDNESGIDFDLSFHIPSVFNPDSIDFEEFYWEYNGGNLSIEYGHSYTLTVNAEIEGQQLRTQSTTSVPQQGFVINSLNFSSLEFAQKKENGDFEFFEVSLQRSPGVTYYLATIRPLDTSFESLIVDHLGGEISKEMYDESFEEITFGRSNIQNTPRDEPGNIGESILRLFWFDFFFFSEYEIIVYAVDDNYREYLQTFQNVQEFDGNFHEAAFNFEGDGIGVFGSIIPDTTYIAVTRPPDE